MQKGVFMRCSKKGKVFLAMVLGVTVMISEAVPVNAMSADCLAVGENGKQVLELEEQERNEMLAETEAAYERFLQEKQEQGLKQKRRMVSQKRTVKYNYEEVLPETREELTVQEQKQVEQAVEMAAAPEDLAELINSYDDAAFEATVREVLDGYYADAGNVKKEYVDAFSVSIDNRADDIIKGYEEALEERQNAGDLDYEAEQVMVVFDEGMTYEQAKKITDRIGDEVLVLDGTGRTLDECVASREEKGRFQLIVGVHIGVSQTVESAIDMLESIEGVEGAQKNGYIEAEGLESTNDPFRPEQGYLVKENVSEAWNAFTLSYVPNYSKVKVAVIDTGVDVNHKELENVISADSITYNGPGGLFAPTSLFECEEPYHTPHGTAIAGIIAANSNNAIGTTGITSIFNTVRGRKVEDVCEILAIDAKMDGFLNNDYAVVAGIRYAVSKGADVINMSFGKNDCDYPVWYGAIEEANKAGVVLVASAGNSNTENQHYPSDFEHVISVAALDTAGVGRASFSNYGSNIDISAIGESVCMILAGNEGEKYIQAGTSYATAQVSAAAALIRAMYPGMSPDRVEFILDQTADDLYPGGWDKYTGYGRVNFGRAVQYAKILQFMYEPVKANEVKATAKNSGLVEVDIEADPYTEMYEIERAEEENGTYKRIAFLPPYCKVENGHIIYQDTNVENGKTYYYRVRKTVYGFYNGRTETYSRRIEPQNGVSL